MEEWIARRIDSVHVLKAPAQRRKRRFIYTVTEFVEGSTLAQWMIDNPRPDLETVRGIVEQVARGLRAFHRLEMLHRDLRPENVLIDKMGTAKIIDFGSVRVAGVAEADPSADSTPVPGALQYAAPEYFLGEGGTPASDLFSLGVIAYQSALDGERELPAWIDGVLKKAVHPDPSRRYQELSEFLYDLRHPSESFMRAARAPLLERNPLLFWKGLAALLAAAVAALLVLHFRG